MAAQVPAQAQYQAQAPTIVPVSPPVLTPVPNCDSIVKQQFMGALQAVGSSGKETA